MQFIEVQNELASHKELLHDIGLGPPISVSATSRDAIRERLNTHSRPPPRPALPVKRKHSYKTSSFGVASDTELGPVQIFAGKQKKGKSVVIAIGQPTEFRLDNNIVPVGFKFIRTWFDHEICGRTVRLPAGVCVCLCVCPVSNV